MDKLSSRTDQEAWKPVPGYEGMYSISSLGQFRSEPRLDRLGRRVRGGPMKTWIRKDGYVAIVFFEDGKRVDTLVHRVVCEVFHGPPPSTTHDVNHKNGVKSDNRPENLEWATRSENVEHSHLTGLRKVFYNPKNRRYYKNTKVQSFEQAPP